MNLIKKTGNNFSLKSSFDGRADLALLATAIVYKLAEKWSFVKNAYKQTCLESDRLETVLKNIKDYGNLNDDELKEIFPNYKERKYGRFLISITKQIWDFFLFDMKEDTESPFEKSMWPDDERTDVISDQEFSNLTGIQIDLIPGLIKELEDRELISKSQFIYKDVPYFSYSILDEYLERSIMLEIISSGI